ncbi:MAG: HD domain-containing protein [Chloroflexota bacterium]|nr:HD domain-containing protein [Chloroflexota bacterium]
MLAQARSARAPRLERPTERPARERPVVAITLSDNERRRRAQHLLAPTFDIAEEGGQTADLVLVDAGGVVPADLADDETAVLEIVGERVAPGPDAARLDGELPRLAGLLVRERRIGRDLDAAADALITLATALESHDRSTLGHSERVAARAVAVARLLGLDEQAVRTVRLGALLRDIGNAKLPPALVQKFGELSSGERELVERHPILGEEILRGLAPLRAILPIVRSHHERLDGQGYPDHLRAEQLPLEVRIVTVADRFEALLVDRTDRVAVSEPEAVRILQGAVSRGELDPAVVAALAAQVRSSEAAR